jgi:hypothetical protein
MSENRQTWKEELCDLSHVTPENVSHRGNERRFGYQGLGRVKREGRVGKC